MTEPKNPESSALAPILDDPIKQLRHDYIKTLLDMAKELSQKEDRNLAENILLFRLLVNMGMQWSLQIGIRHELAKLALGAKTKGLAKVALTILSKKR